MAKIVGLDLGSNSIGWAVIDNEKHCIEAAGSRIIPMDAGRLGDFEKGNSVSFTEERTRYRGMRRLRERYLLRRERLLRVLRIMGFLPEHFASQLSRYGQLPVDKEPKLAWKEDNDGNHVFLFQSSFEEMVSDFRKAGIAEKIPYDWTIYYLRQKALSKPISKEELAWILMQFNQKRGYYQLRGKVDQSIVPDEEKQEEKSYLELKIIKVEDSGEKDKKGKSWFNITLENGWVYKRPLLSKPDWEGKTRGFIATFKLDKDGTHKDDTPKLSSPSEDDWGLRKIKTENDIRQSGKTIGSFIYNSLIYHPDRKIIGDLVQTIDRELYKEELRKILDTQSQYMHELKDMNLYKKCIEEIYPSNEAYRNSISSRGFTYLLVEDILFYQRPLKSKRSLIANCPFEQRHGKAIKCIAKSHPIYQEFRLWQFLSNLKIYKDEEDITATLLPDGDSYANLYDYLSSIKEADQQILLRYFRIGKKDMPHYRWNYAQERKYPMGETLTVLLGGLRKAGIETSFLTSENELLLWHLLYSVDDQIQYSKALKKIAHKQGWNNQRSDAFCQAFDKLTVYKEKDYGAYSAKAFKRLLPLMRRGRYWKESAIDVQTLSRIEHIITGEEDSTLTPKVREVFKGLSSIQQFQGLQTWQACYLVYNRHSESIDAQKWTKPEDIDLYLAKFRHNSLNNPVVEQVVTESLRVVRDIWKQIGHIDEIHIELGRELKKTKAEREYLSQSILKGETTNQRIRLLLTELMNPELEVENVRPQSPSQMEILKLYEEGAMQSGAEIPDDIMDIQKRFTAAKNQPTTAEVKRYRLWLDQKYISPYTGRPIPLAKLFTQAYEIEHVIPQSRWFDDSMSNKVICEAEVNKLKNRELGHEFIAHHQGERVSLNLGGTVEILSLEAYEKLVKTTFPNPKKREKLMLDDIPEDFTSRQMNDSRYISRLLLHLLSNIVRTEDEEGHHEESVTSKNVIPCNGTITDRLKREWGINDVWNRIILPRFERMNSITNSNEYTATTENGHIVPQVPLNMRQGFNKKRIDHRHHAMDAIIIACATRNHINLLNNENAKGATRYDLQRTLRTTDYYVDEHGNKHTCPGNFIKPWPTFTEDVYRALETIIVSFKQNQRIINKTSNYYTIIENGKPTIQKQKKGDSWAIRKPLHKETVFGEVNLQLKKRIKIKDALANPKSIVDRELKEKIEKFLSLHHSNKQIIDYFDRHKDIWPEASDGRIEVYYYTKDTEDRYFATRKDLISIFKDITTMSAAQKAIDSITDSGIRAILQAHLSLEGNNPAEAFSPDGLERMNRNIYNLNREHCHMPIKKVRVYEQANKFSVGSHGQKATKYVEAAKGTNLFFVIYNDKNGSRGYATVPLNVVIELQKQYEKCWKEHLTDRLQQKDLELMPVGAHLLYILSPGDLVYVPTNEERKNGITSPNPNRIYKVVSMTGIQFMCISHRVAAPIVNKMEFTTSNKMEKALTGEMIKENCIPLKVDHLGNIIKIG